MQSQVAGILAAINNRTNRYNVISCETHERYQSNLGFLPHTFFLYRKEGFVKWKRESCELPANHIILDGSENQIKPDMCFDMCLAQQIFGQFQHLKPLSDRFNIPLIRLEHTCPTWQNEKRTEELTVNRGDINVFISKWSVNAWKFDLNDPSVRVVEHCVDTNVFKPDVESKKDGCIKTVVNDWIGRSYILGFDIFKRICEGLPISPVGATEGFSQLSPSREDLIKKLQSSSVFLNTSRLSPIPTSLLEAMSVGLPVVTTSTCAISDIVVNGVNGWISNDEPYLRDRLQWCLNNPEKAQELGNNARNTILERFSIQKHLIAWNSIFKEWFQQKYIKERLSIRSIAKILNIGSTSVLYRLRHYNIKCRTRNDREYTWQKYLNKEYFKTWSSDMAWILGFLMADGCVGIRNYKDKTGNFNLKVKLQPRDISVLRFIQNKLCPQKPIIKIKAHLKTTNKTYDGITFTINSKHMVMDLISLGVINKKNW